MRGNVECSAKSDIVFGAETKGGNKIFGGMGLLVLVVFERERKKRKLFKYEYQERIFTLLYEKNIMESESVSFQKRFLNNFISCDERIFLNRQLKIIRNVKFFLRVSYFVRDKNCFERFMRIFGGRGW